MNLTPIATLTLRFNGETITTFLKDRNDELSSSLVLPSRESPDGQTVDARTIGFKLISASAAEGRVEFEANGLPGTMLITAATPPEGNHWQNPHYAVTWNGQSFSYDIQDGEACIGCSIRLLFGIMSVKAMH